MEDGVVIIVALIALIAGAAIGWLLGNRAAAGAKQTTDALRLQLDGVVAERDDARGEAARHRDEIQKLSVAKAELERDVGNFDKQLKEFREAKEDLLKEFQNAGSAVLDKAQEAFLQRADQRFKQSEEVGEQRIKALLQPVGDKLKAYEQSVREMEADRKKEYGSISGLMEQVRLGQEAVKAEASSIVTSLRAGPKTSGRWGEQQFKNLIELAGLSEFTDFHSEVSVQSDDGSLRPDYVINLPGGRRLIVDIKCPLDAYLTATEKLDPGERKSAFERFSIAVKGHANSLSKKAYWAQFEQSPDFVILYIPGDNFLSAALEHLPKMWEEAARNHVIISGPATFLPLARTIAAMWDQERLADKAQEVLDLGRELHENLAIMTDRIRRLGTDIGKTANSYNEFIKSIDGKVILRARRFEELNLTKSEKRLGDLRPSEEQLRPLQRLMGPDEE